MQSPRLFALRPDGSALNWKRSVPQTAMLAGINDRQVYLTSDELLAFDLKTEELLWSQQSAGQIVGDRAACDFSIATTNLRRAASMRSINRPATGAGFFAVPTAIAAAEPSWPRRI